MLPIRILLASVSEAAFLCCWMLWLLLLLTLTVILRSGWDDVIFIISAIQLDKLAAVGSAVLYADLSFQWHFQAS